MHRIFLIPEVVHQVMEYLHPCTTSDQLKRELKAMLLNVALTCTSFSGPALDVLWHTMDDLLPLFKLLPNFELSVDKALPNDIWDEDDIFIFNAYARRIRRYEPKSINNIDSSAYSRILRRCDRSHLLPNLKHYKPATPSLAEVLFLLCPHLKEFSLPFPPSPQHSRDDPTLFLKSLQLLSPNLVVLRLHYVVLDNQCLSVFCILTRLEKLVVVDASSETVPVTLDFLFHMSARHTLRYLELDGELLEIVPFSQSLLNRDPVIFSALEHIHIDCTIAIDSVAIFLRDAKFPVLEVFIIGLKKDVLEPHQSMVQHGYWHETFVSICQATTDHFCTLKFFGSSHESSVQFHLFDISVLPTLSLTSFALDGLVIGLTQRDVSAIVDAWPLLTTLTLQHFEDIPEMEFSVLITIAHGLPQLRYLTLSIDATLHPDLEEIPLLCHDLHSFTLTNSPLDSDDAKLIAQSLDRLFPRLQVWDFECAIWEPWEEVDSLLEMLHQVRKDDSRRSALVQNDLKP